ncbi:MAG: biopolymer transporter ExbD [Polaromonas sp.]|nr:MAG: biopolymer transporter ExbD [Polaromonas sp.]
MPAINPRGRGRRTISEINMVPFIDVMLVLLIIFMVTAPLITPSMIALPKVGKASGQPQNPIQILISKDETVQIKFKKDTSPTTVAATVASTVASIASDIVKLEPKVKSAAPGEQAVPVVISADKSIQYETVVQVMDKLQKAGVVRIGLSVQTGNTSR